MAIRIYRLNRIISVIVHLNIFYVPASYIIYLSGFCRFLLCTCGWERRGVKDGGEGGWSRGGARGRGIYCIYTYYMGTILAIMQEVCSQ